MFKKRSLLVFAIVALMLAVALAPRPAVTQAATPALRFGGPVTVDSCDATSITMSYTVIHGYTYSTSYSFPSSGTINGVVVFDEGLIPANPAAPFSFYQSFPFPFAAQSASYTYIHTWTTLLNGVPVYKSTLTGTCTFDGEVWTPGTASTSDQDLGLGCDIALPSTAVMGALVADANAYWAPGKLTSPLYTLPAGKTAYVIGLDESGDYYKILWVCQYLWVQKDTMGPDFDDVWQGHALPTDIVQ